MSYVVYATKENGEGHVTKLGEYKDVEDIQIRAGMFHEDVVIDIVEEQDDRNKFRGNWDYGDVKGEANKILLISPCSCLRCQDRIINRKKEELCNKKQ